MLDDDEDTKPMLEVLPSKKAKDETTKIIRKVDSAPRHRDKFLDAALRTEQERHQASTERESA